MPYYKRKKIGSTNFGVRKVQYKLSRVKRRVGPKRRMNIPRMVSRIMNRKIETKEAQIQGATNQAIAHNNVRVLTDSSLGNMNIFASFQGASDPMSGSDGRRVGDELTVKGISINMFLDNPVDRANVHYRIMCPAHCVSATCFPIRPSLLAIARILTLRERTHLSDEKTSHAQLRQASDGHVPFEGC
jgi:hypothetical protein